MTIKRQQMIVYLVDQEFGGVFSTYLAAESFVLSAVVAAKADVASNSVMLPLTMRFVIMASAWL